MIQEEHAFTTDAIQRQLAQILESPAFDVSERLKEFLSFVVGKTLDGHGGELKGQTIATEVFRRGDDFDSAHDSIVRVEARKIRQALDNYYLRDGAHDPIRIRMPKGTYAPTFEYQTASTVDLPKEEGSPKIVVMPFELFSDDATQSYLAAGLTEEVTTALSCYKNLRVIASGSARHLHKQGISELEIGQTLKVRFLLQGCIQQNGTALKVSVKLIDTKSGTLCWSEHFRRQLKIEEIFDLQEEIARSVVARIGGVFGILSHQIFSEARKKTPPSLSAYEALLTYYHYVESIGPDSFHNTLSTVKATLEQETEYGSLWSALAAMYADNFVAAFCPTETFPLQDAEHYARKGVELDPDNQSTHMASAYVYLIRNDLKRYAEEAKYAYTLNPNNAYYVGAYGYLEILAGHWERGSALLQEGIRLNPHHPKFLFIASFLHAYALHNYQKAYDEALKIDLPGLYLCPVYQAAALGQLGRQNEAKALLETLVQVRPDFPTRAHELTGRLIKAEGQVEHILEGLQKADLRIREVAEDERSSVSMKR